MEIFLPPPSPSLCRVAAAFFVILPVVVAAVLEAVFIFRGEHFLLL